MNLAAALAQDLDGAFPALVDSYQDALYRFALRLSGSSQDAEEIAQEAFVRAYSWLRKTAGQRPELRIQPWLYRITLNVFRNRARVKQPAPAALDEARQLAASGAGPEAQVEARETRTELTALLVQLPLRYREALLLRHVEDLSYPEIASVLRRPEGTVKSDVHRGLALLRIALSPTPEGLAV